MLIQIIVMSVPDCLWSQFGYIRMKSLRYIMQSSLFIKQGCIRNCRKSHYYKLKENHIKITGKTDFNSTKYLYTILCAVV
jgi:hypothetical protein